MPDQKDYIPLTTIVPTGMSVVTDSTVMSAGADGSIHVYIITVHCLQHVQAEWAIGILLVMECHDKAVTRYHSHD